ncbi:prominin-1-A-like [Mya arenaria]|uniref:prominin-1-A-like n=1 Tax=Mya arenaria TaxID=6604 RepID=UPI0022E6211B|nr:prominin-1-A-like [Mya arenaria]
MKCNKTRSVLVGLCLLVCLLGTYDVTSANAVITDKWGNAVYDNGTVKFVDCPVGNKSYVTNTTYDDGGLGMIFAFARDFIDTVQPNDFPFGVLSEVINGTFEIGEDYMELVQYSVGFASCFAIGLLFVIFLPLCGCCICCCRCCCGNCGGDLKATYDSNEDCKRMGLAQALFMMVVLMAGAAGCVWMTNGRFTVAIEYTENNLVTNLNDVEVYFNNVLEQFMYISGDMFSPVAQAILDDIEDLGVVIENAIFDNLNIDDVIDSVLALDATVNNISTALTQVSTDTDALVAASDALTTAMNDLGTDIDTTTSSCSTSGAACQTACDTFDTTPLKSGSADFSSLPDLSSVQTQVDAVVAMNLTRIATEAEAGVDDVSSLVSNSTADIRTSEYRVPNMRISAINSTMNDFTVVIQNMTNQLNESLNGTVDLGSFASGIEDFFGMLAGYDTYRVYFGWGLSGLFTVIVLLAILGICCGCLGQDSDKLPTERGFLSNTGGCLLIIPVIMMFVVGSMLMLLTTLTFIIGGNMEKLCQPLSDLSMFRDFVDKGDIAGMSLGELLHGNKSIDISFYSFFLGCRANEAPFKLLALDQLLPLEQYLNFTNYTSDMKDQMGDMTSTIDLSAFSILTPDMETALTDLRDSGLGDIDFAAINSTLGQSAVDIDFDTLISAMEVIRDSCSGAAYTNWDSHITDMETIRDVTYPDVTTAQSDLQDSMSVLETHLNGLEAAINATLLTAEEADDQLQNNITGVLTDAVEDFVDRIINYIQQFADKVLDMVYNEIGLCLPIWNVYDSFVSIVCNYMVESLNAFWFGTGWGLLFFIPVMVLCMKLSKYYRRMDKQEGFKEDEDPLDEDIDDFSLRYDSMQKQNRVAPDPEFMD